MCKSINVFGQEEYTRVLDAHRAHDMKLSQTQCERLLIEHGASKHQAKDGAYVYLHHGGFDPAQSRNSQSVYNPILEKFGGARKTYIECVEHLKTLGFTYGQAKNAVYKYRQQKKLIGH